MQTIKKEYRTIDNNTYKIEIYFKNKCWYGRYNKGYYLSINKINYINNGSYSVETYSPADGYLALITEANRLSEKSKKEALNIVTEEIILNGVNKCK